MEAVTYTMHVNRLSVSILSSEVDKDGWPITVFQEKRSKDAIINAQRKLIELRYAAAHQSQDEENADGK